MKALLLAIKKIITVITAILVPASSTAPAIVPTHRLPANTDTVIVAPQEETQEPEYEIVEDKGYENEPQAEEPQAEEPQQEAPAQETEYAAAEEFEAVETWDVSATENDDVTMSFYNTEDVEALLNQLAGRIGSIFTPMVAYAAEEDDRTVVDNEDRLTVTEGDSTLIFDKDALVTTGNQENGDDGSGEEQPQQAVQGTVVVSGTGNMMDYVYNYFVSPQKYIDTMKSLFMEYEGLDVTPVYDESITDVVELDYTIEWVITGTDEQVYYTLEMLEHFNPADTLAYCPTKVIINPGVTNISDCAFVFCSTIEEVVISEGVTSIGVSAFEKCKNLRKVVLPESLKKVLEYAFYDCSSLDEIYIKGTFKRVEAGAFKNINEQATVYYINDAALNRLNSDNIDASVTFVKYTEPVVETTPEEVNNAEN